MLTGSRRQFMRWIATAMAVGFAGVLRSVTQRLTALQPRSRPVVVPADFPQDVAFAGEVAVCRTENGVRALSARCTHLGCAISQHADGELVCSCHGSRFRLDGSVARGPAIRPLEVLPHHVDRAAGTIVVQPS